MARLTNSESNRADTWTNGMSEPDDVTDDRDAADLRAGWALVDAG
jgi:hypothetical protein